MPEAGSDGALALMETQSMGANGQAGSANGDGITVVITAVGEDRPGIVAAIAGAMFAMGANLDDATMTRLHDAFATMVSAVLPAGRTAADSLQALAPVAERLGLTVTVQAVRTDAPHGSEPDHVVSVYGADKPGIVYGVTSRLAGLAVNITDMDTRVAGSPEAPVYVMLLEVAAGATDLAAELDGLRRELGVDIAVREIDTEAL